MYRFLIFRPGRHLLRLYFYPLLHPSYNLTRAFFTVKTDSIVLLHDFSLKDNTRFSLCSSSPVGVFSGLSNYAFEVSYRVNVGGPIIPPKGDRLWRTWQPDDRLMTFPQGAKNVSVPPDIINYPEGGATPLIAPNLVYSTASEMADSGTPNPNFNLTWTMC
ncbi:hypothetical protein RJ639_000776 [Escallonia herrerae]|uniref:Malectin-like domain-containing protein n=1 Tax=Escallonia herrerae TaxID=1293975 RepID=A0AA89BIU4_9ASTE|nr:hypothetical protein RJ639_000776 [Escallonia herrerae]